MSDAADRAFLDEAVALAERGINTTTPNPRVGCVIVRDGRVLGRGWHQWRGEAHAEVRALQDAGGDVAGASVYVSLEPCCIQGATPPCTDTLIAAKVGRVVVGALDPDSRVNGGGVARLRAAGLRVDLAQHEAAQRLNAPHRHRLQTGRPWVRIKLAASMDGRTAMASGASQWITGAAARQDVQHWRARSCAVLTGINTLLADDPMLNVRDDRFAVDGRLRQPLRVVVDSRRRTPPNAKLFQEAGPVLVATAGFPTIGPRQAETTEPSNALASAPAAPGEEWPAQAEIVQCGLGKAEVGSSESQAGSEAGKVNLKLLLDVLGAKPCNEVLVEAGPILAGAFVAAGLWDELLLYLAPKFLGSTARPLLGFALERLEESVSGRIIDTQAFGPDLRIRLAKA